MLERSEKALRMLCLVLGAVLVLELALKVVSRNPLSGLKIPALPTVSTEAGASAAGKNTNTASAKTPEAQAGNKGSNSVSAQKGPVLGTNLANKASSTQEVHSAEGPMARNPATNVVAELKATSGETNQVVSPHHRTNLTAEAEMPKPGSNTVAKLETNGASTNSTSVASRSHSTGKGTNSVARPEMAMNGPNRPGGRPGMGQQLADLPPATLARVDRVVDSELFGPVFHPMPAGLLGIAGNVAFLRGPSGQTGVAKEGEEVGGLKLLRIGVNRVLVEENGQKKELMIFEGLGGQSLLSN